MIAFCPDCGFDQVPAAAGLRYCPTCTALLQHSSKKKPCQQAKAQGRAAYNETLQPYEEYVGLLAQIQPSVQSVPLAVAVILKTLHVSTVEEAINNRPTELVRAAEVRIKEILQNFGQASFDTLRSVQQKEIAYLEGEGVDLPAKLFAKKNAVAKRQEALDEVKELQLLITRVPAAALADVSSGTACTTVDRTLVSSQNRPSVSSNNSAANVYENLTEDFSSCNIDTILKHLAQHRNKPLKQVKNICMLLGRPGHGKSTLANWLLGEKIVKSSFGRFGRFRGVLTCASVRPGLEIGHGPKTQTFFLQCYPIPGTDVELCDTPGLGDTGDINKVIPHAVAITSRLHECETVRVVLVVSFELLVTNYGVCFRNLLDEMKQFINDQDDGYTPLVVYTHVRDNSDWRDIAETLATRKSTLQDMGLTREDQFLYKCILDLTNYKDDLIIRPHKSDADRFRAIIMEQPCVHEPKRMFACPLDENAQARLDLACKVIKKGVQDNLTNLNFANVTHSLDKLCSLADASLLPRIIKTYRETIGIVLTYFRRKLEAANRAFDNNDFCETASHLNAISEDLLKHTHAFETKDNENVTVSAMYNNLIDAINAKTQELTRLPNCKLFLTSSSLWIGVIIGPKESSYRGGVFKVHLTLSPPNAFSAKFVPPIHHCNVDEKTGEIAFPKSMFGVAAAEVLCAISDLLTTPAAASRQNEAAVQLFKTDRVQYDSLARKAASSFWLGALDDEMKLIPNILDLFLPQHVMSGAAQLETFRKLALHEAETLSAARVSVHVHVQNLELEHFQQNVLAHRAAEAVTQLKGNLDEALYELTSYTKYGKPDFENKIKSLEQEMTISYLQEHVVGSPVAQRRACRPSVKCMEEMIMEAKAENGKLSKLMTFCFKKYEALSARFIQLQGIEEQKADLAQILDDKVPFFVAQAKYLESDFRSILCGLVDQFNRNELPASIKGQDSKELFSELRLTSGQHAKVIFAPQKSVQRLQEKMEEQRRKACEVFDYLRATIVMADPALLTMFYRALSLDTRFRIVRVKNKLSIDLDQPPNVHVNLEFRGHIGEVQLILEDFLLIKEHSHKPYELTRIGLVRGDLVRGAELRKAVESVVSNGVYLLHPGKLEH